MRGDLRRLRYGLLSHLPGRRGARYRRKAASIDSARAFERALAQVRGGVCVDLGANVGEVTRRMAAVASKVWAFEPDPWTVARLREATIGLDNVEVIEAAAGVSDGTVRLYRAAGFDADPVERSLSSSTLVEKSNVDAGSWHEVRQVDLPAFLAGLDHDIAILKIDIEGAEVELLEALLDHPVAARIGFIFAETHERRVPALAARTEALRRRVAGLARPVVDLFWR